MKRYDPEPRAKLTAAEAPAPAGTNGAGTEAEFTCTLDLHLRGPLDPVVTTPASPRHQHGTKYRGDFEERPKKQINLGNVPDTLQHERPELCRLSGTGAGGDSSLPGWLQSVELLGTAVFLALITLGWHLLAAVTILLVFGLCASYHARRATWLTPRIKNLTGFGLIASVMVMLPFVAMRVGGA